MKTKTTTPQDLRKFGLLLGGIFSTLFGMILPLMADAQIPFWPWVLALALWFPAIIAPKALKQVYQAWMKIGDVLGFINTRILLGLLFFVVITPIGLLKRTLSADTMGKQYDKKLKSYRTVCTSKPIQHMEKPFS